MSTWKNKFKAILSVYLILKNKKGEILLLRRVNTGHKDGEFGLPAGHVDGNENLLSAMRREAKEEVGIDVNADELQMVHTMHRNCGDHERVDFFFTVDLGDHAPYNAEPEKCSELKWHSIPSVVSNNEVIDYYRHAFQCIENGEIYSGYNW